MSADLPRLLFAGTGSGLGKTTLVCALLAALARRGMKTAPFKCGPDYIDPLFHARAAGTPSHNLDLFLCGHELVLETLACYAKGADLAVIEGVMGLYDGVGQGQGASSNELSLGTRTPVVLVVAPRGQSLSLCAEIHGFLHFRPNRVQGIVLNNTSPRMASHFRGMIEDSLEIPVFGAMPPVSAQLESRHLGLVTPEEAADLPAKLAELATVFEEHMDMEGLLALARGAGPLPEPAFRAEALSMAEAAPCPEAPLATPFPPDSPAVPGAAYGKGMKASRPPVIGVARDRAFCFYYEDMFALFSELGAELRFFSPLRDRELPAGVSGLFFGGGYPEEHAEALSLNASMRGAVYAAARGGMPVVAECGGYMYLCEALANRQGREFPMAGVLPVRAFMRQRLARFGYITLTAECDTLLCPAGTEIRGHEFHYGDSTNNGNAFIARKADGKAWPCIHAQGAVFAGYPHFHWRANLPLARNFVAACAARQGLSSQDGAAW
jgi:Cobyrinic acid a,c-diamide synthase